MMVALSDRNDLDQRDSLAEVLTVNNNVRIPFCVLHKPSPHTVPTPLDRSNTFDQS